MAAKTNQENRSTILVVEDDIDIRKLISKFIKKAISCKILLAADGLEALTIILKDSPKLDLIILDVELPFFNGEEVLKTIRSRGELDDIPIIMCTAINAIEHVKRIMSHRIDGYLTKPVEKKQLLTKILSLLNT